MNRQFRTISALLRHTWAIEPTYAGQYMPQVDAYFNGQLDLRTILASEQSDDSDTEEESGPPPHAFCLRAGSDSGSAGTATRYSIDDPELPEGSILILDVRGPIMKESNCCTIGTEEYAQLIRKAYAHPAIIGGIALVDTPGGQLNGTPTLYDAVRDPAKPFVTVINEGMACSAGVWAFCGSDYIYATQKTDQVGSIGVFVRLRDNTKQLEQDGIKEIAVYSTLSPDKNKPYKDALKGDTKLLEEDLDYAATMFREAVTEGRGERLNLKAGDPFTGKVFYAAKAIELGLIDGFGNLDTAIAKVQELHAARQEGSSGATVTVAPQSGSAAPTTSQSQNTDMLGYVKFKSLAAIHGLAAADITEAHVKAINQEMAEQGYNVAVVSQKEIDDAGTLQGQVNALNAKVTTLEGQVTTLTTERDTHKANAEKYAKLPGAEASGDGKTEEQSTVGDQETFISETDRELQRLKGKA
ncbi:S49 family peptidase [Arsenicibacter rosenii]|uniref:Peptidase S49 domain-containing protein n=1 Tax=Arsenicibacter rosenii TaxID=1750698 RepID=A0A1S2VDL5_9BACT|nr:S49 family peptidase [Arsenicibacter rosenii]OIN56792.1 hypothetical protein BLX24_22720 [Arsenicibacter rosenii]